MKRIFWVLFGLSVLIACNSENHSRQTLPPSDSLVTISDSIAPPSPPPPVYKPMYTPTEKDSLFALSDTTWIDMELLDTSIVMDIRYATTNNFMKLQVYDCAKCYTRLATAKAILKIQDALQEQGLGLKMYDCYRPQAAQLKLWNKLPDRRYVAPPSRGSVHSRGGALDLTIVELGTQRELAMGTEYDYFGREAYWSYSKHPEEVNNNRQLLRSTMEKFGFKTTSTEWWHYSYRKAWYQLSNMQWNCEDK